MMPDTLNSKPASLSHIKETCLYIQDTTRTRAFYEGLLGIPCIAEVPEQFVFFRLHSDMLLCFIPRFTQNNPTLPAHGGSGVQHIAFEAASSENYEQWKVFLASQGVIIEHEAIWGAGKRSFYFRDPDGHSVEITEPDIWASYR